MNQNDREFITDNKLSESRGMTKKKFIIYLLINLLTIVLLIITSTTLFYANENLKNEIGSIKKQCDSVGGLVNEKYKLITDLLKEKYDISINLSEKKTKSFADLFDEKYQLEALFNVSSVNKIGYIGYNTILECNTGEERPISMEYHWYYNGNEVMTLNTTQNGDLEIKNLTENEAGNYRCLLTYGHNYKNVTYNLEIKHAYQLVDFGSLEKFKDLGYKTINAGSERYLGQTKNASSLLPGKINPNSVSMSCIFNDIYYETRNFKVFVIHENLKDSWVKRDHGNVAPNAFEAGQSADGEKLYFARNGDSFGVIQPSTRIMKSISRSGDYEYYYEILCLEDLKNN